MIKVILLTLFSFAPADSLRTETINGKLFIIHQVSTGETLYAIARRYKSSVDLVKKANENIEQGIKDGQLIRIPVEKKDQKTGVVKEKQLEKTHVVIAKESLSSIARLYKLSVKQLKELNALEVDEVKIGQILVVSGNPKIAEKKETVKVDKSIEKKEVAKIDKQPIVEKKIKEIQKTEVVKPIERKEEVITISENTPGSDESKETGLAEIMEGTEGSRKYLALHRTIKVGSIVKVKNEATNKEVFVRVTGALTATDVNEKVIIKISRSAFDRLGGTDTGFQAEVTYYK